VIIIYVDLYSLLPRPKANKKQRNFSMILKKGGDFTTWPHGIGTLCEMVRKQSYDWIENSDKPYFD